MRLVSKKWDVFADKILEFSDKYYGDVLVLMPHFILSSAAYLLFYIVPMILGTESHLASMSGLIIFEISMVIAFFRICKMYKIASTMVLSIYVSLLLEIAPNIIQILTFITVLEYLAHHETSLSILVGLINALLLISYFIYKVTQGLKRKPLSTRTAVVPLNIAIILMLTFIIGYLSGYLT